MNEVIIRRGANGSLFAGDRNGHEVAHLVPSANGRWWVTDHEAKTTDEHESRHSAHKVFFAIVSETLDER